MENPIRRGPSAARLAAATWRKSTHSGQLGNCVEAASLDSGKVALRNSRYPSGPILIFSRDEMAAFLAGAKDDEFDDGASSVDLQPATPECGRATSPPDSAEQANFRAPGRGEMHEPRTQATLATWFTCEFDRTDHAISDDNMILGFSVGAGRYAALCGTTVCVSPLVCPPGRRCLSCEAIVQRADRESLPRKTGGLTRSCGRGRHRDGTTGR